MRKKDPGYSSSPFIGGQIPYGGNERSKWFLPCLFADIYCLLYSVGLLKNVLTVWCGSITVIDVIIPLVSMIPHQALTNTYQCMHHGYAVDAWKHSQLMYVDMQVHVNYTQGSTSVTESNNILMHIFQGERDYKTFNSKHSETSSCFKNITISKQLTFMITD